MAMRIHKFLSRAGISSRRKGEELVQRGKVLVNGLLAKIGQVIDETQDEVIVDGKKITVAQEKVSYLVNKPRFYISSVKDPEGRKTVMSLVPGASKLFPVGRLDYESEGLMLLTNDGDLAYKLTHPKFEVNKTYHVQVKGNLSDVKIKKLEYGVMIEGKKTAPAKIKNVIKEGERTWFDITIHEGRNRQIRKMGEAVHLPVTRLIRTHLGPYELGDLKPGEYKQILI